MVKYDAKRSKRAIKAKFNLFNDRSDISSLRTTGTRIKSQSNKEQNRKPSVSEKARPSPGITTNRQRTASAPKPRLNILKSPGSRVSVSGRNQTLRFLESSGTPELNNDMSTYLESTELSPSLYSIPRQSDKPTTKLSDPKLVPQGFRKPSTYRSSINYSLGLPSREIHQNLNDLLTEVQSDLEKQTSTVV